MNSVWNREKPWDAVVVGAGPAGSVAAALLAERGWEVLLLERRVWPRAKACGGCLNAAGVRLLEAAGLGSVLAGAMPVERLQVRLGERRVDVEMPRGVAVDRETFDAGLVKQAVGRGVVFVDGAKAGLVRGIGGGRCRGFREIAVERDGEVGRGELRVRGRMVLACDGIQGTLLREEAWARWRTAADAAIGISTTVRDRSFPAGTIGMCVGSGGYVGLVRQNESTVHVGAALHPEACAGPGGAGGLARRILAENGFHFVMDSRITGVGPMTRQREVAGEGVLAIGDACGYIEPFTGEGLAWAIRGACEAARLLGAAGREWTEELGLAWKQVYAREVAGRQSWCRMLQGITRRPATAAACMRVAEWFPSIPRMVAERIGA